MDEISRLYQDIEYEYYHEFCLVEPSEDGINVYLNRYKALSQKDKTNAIIKSKEWGNAKLTNLMQQML